MRQTLAFAIAVFFLSGCEDQRQINKDLPLEQVVRLRLEADRDRIQLPANNRTR